MDCVKQLDLMFTTAIAIIIVIVASVVLYSTNHQQPIVATFVLEEPVTEVNETENIDTTTLEVATEDSLSAYVEENILTDREREVLAKLLYGEANYGCVKEVERSMVIWCVLNRLDSKLSWFGTTIEEIVTNPNQFTGYHEDAPVTKKNLDLVDDVISRWEREKTGVQNVGRTLPKEYLFFVADGSGKHNEFYCWSSGGIGNTNDQKIWYSYATPVENPYV